MEHLVSSVWKTLLLIKKQRDYGEERRWLRVEYVVKDGWKK